MALIRYVDPDGSPVFEERTAESCAPQKGDYVLFPDNRKMHVTSVMHNLSHNKFDRFIEVQVLDVRHQVKGEDNGQDF